MAAVLFITADFESTRHEVIAAMLFPRDDAYRVSYRIRNQWERQLQSGEKIAVSASDLQAILNLHSRQELRVAAKEGTKRGNVAGDLLAMMYEDWCLKKSEPSLRAALRRYPEWSVGKKYGDGSPLLYSDAQLRRYFSAAEPAAHLWAAFRLLQYRVKDRTAFTRAELPRLLGVARAVQDFATTFIPKRTKPAKPVIDFDTILQIPAHIQPIQLGLRPL